MSAKTIIYLSILSLALVSLAVGGWVVKGVKAFARQTREPEPRLRWV